MSITRLKETFLRMPRHMQFIGLGSLLLAVATFLPWYADIDSYNIGVQFLGVKGPAWLIGITILVMSLISLTLFGYHLLEKRLPKLPVKEGTAHMFIAGEALFLLVIANSIFFHPQFGVNITFKESGFGTILGFAGALLLLFGAYKKNAHESEDANDKGRLEPLIKMQHAPERPAPIMGTYDRGHSSVAPIKEEPRRVPMPPKESVQVSEVKPGTPQEKDPNSSYMIRMDL